MFPSSAANKGEIWKSSNESIAKVDSIGYITGLSAGKCTITVTSADNPDVSASIAVTVNSSSGIEGILVSDPELEIVVGSYGMTYITFLPQGADQNAVWESSDPSVASMTANNFISANKVGSCIITVRSAVDPSIKAEIKVTVIEPKQEVPGTVLSSRAYFDTGEGLLFLTPFPTNANGRFVIEYVISYKDGSTSTIVTDTLTVPGVSSSSVRLTEKNGMSFVLTPYITNIDTGYRAKIGSYTFNDLLGSFQAESEDINYAFYIIGGLAD